MAIDEFKPLVMQRCENAQQKNLQTLTISALFDTQDSDARYEKEACLTRKSFNSNERHIDSGM